MRVSGSIELVELVVSMILLCSLLLFFLFSACAHACILDDCICGVLVVLYDFGVMHRF